MFDMFARIQLFITPLAIDTAYRGYTSVFSVGMDPLEIKESYANGIENDPDKITGFASNYSLSSRTEILRMFFHI